MQDEVRPKPEVISTSATSSAARPLTATAGDAEGRNAGSCHELYLIAWLSCLVRTKTAVQSAHVIVRP